jgi:hypothetical protein
MSSYTTPTRRELPRSLSVLRILLVVGGVIGILATVGFLVSEGFSAENVGAAIWAVWPGVAAVLLARGLPEGGVRRFWGIVVVGAVWVLMGLAQLGRGEPRALTSLVIPIAILVLVTRKSARDRLIRR